MTIKTTIALSLALAAGLSISAKAAPALSPDQEPRSVAVHYGDLNLDSEAGMQTLNQRIRGAVRIVCGPTPSPVEALQSYAYRSCIKSSHARAMMDLEVHLATAGAHPASMQLARGDAR